MNIMPLIGADQQVIQSYGKGRFKISGRLYNHAVIVFPDTVYEWSYEGSLSDMTHFHLQPLLDRCDDVDVVLIGSGIDFIHPGQDLINRIKDMGLLIEIMDSAAACRTYNVLMAEGRRVAAAILPV